MPEKWIQMQRFFVAAIAENIVLTKFINCWNSSGNLYLMLLHAFSTPSTNSIIAAHLAKIVFSITLSQASLAS